MRNRDVIAALSKHDLDAVVCVVGDGMGEPCPYSVGGVEVTEVNLDLEIEGFRSYGFEETPEHPVTVLVLNPSTESSNAWRIQRQLEREKRLAEARKSTFMDDM